MVRDLSKFAVGDKVRHKEHGFAGVVEEIQSNSLKVRITEGKHPWNPNNTYYLGHLFEKVEENAFEKMMEEAMKMLAEVGTDKDTDINTSGYVDLKLPDGTEINFEHYSDFERFLERNNL